MVSSVSWQLNSRNKITGFGARKRVTRSNRGRATCGRGIIRRTIGALSRPALTFVANKIADAIAGKGRRKIVRRRTAVRGSSFKLTGMGRRPRSNLRRRRTYKPRCVTASSLLAKTRRTLD